MYSPQRSDMDLLRSAYKCGIVDTSISFQSMPFLAGRTLRSKSTAVAFIENVDQNAEALRSQVHTFERTDVFDPDADHLIELARIVVPEGNIGYLEDIDQYLADSEGRFYATRTDNWGMPYNETVDVSGINWHFRLDNYYGIWPEQYYATAGVIPNYRSLLPGYSWRDMPEFSGIWYPAHKNICFRGTIPAAHMLRMFAFISKADLEIYSWRLAARLTARVQTEMCREAEQNTRILS